MYSYWALGFFGGVTFTGLFADTTTYRGDVLLWGYWQTHMFLSLLHLHFLVILPYAFILDNIFWASILLLRLLYEREAESKWLYLGVSYTFTGSFEV